MAYNKDEIIKLALEKIVSEECSTISEVISELPISQKTFYLWELHELQEIKDAINQQKVNICKKLRRRWRDSDNATLQIAEFKLACTDEQLDRLNTQRVNTNLTVNKPGISLTIGAEQDDNG